MKRITFFLLAWIMVHTALYAQISISNPKEKFSLSATIDGVTNSDYTWDTNSHDHIADGQMKHGINARLKSNISLVSSLIFSVSISPFYNYCTTNLQTDWMGAPMFDFPEEHHHYGATLSGSMNMMLGSKPITFLATTAPNFSQYGYENMSGVLGTMVHITRKPDTYLALGAIYLYGSPLSWPLYPLLIYRHKFNDNWSVSLMELNDYIYYHASPKMKYGIGMELVSDMMYFRPNNENLPKKALYSLLSEHMGLYANMQLTKEVSLELSTGANIPIWGRLRESGHEHVYMKLHDKVKPFFQLKMNYSIMRKQ